MINNFHFLSIHVISFPLYFFLFFDLFACLYHTPNSNPTLSPQGEWWKPGASRHWANETHSHRGTLTGPHSGVFTSQEHRAGLWQHRPGMRHIIYLLSRKKERKNLIYVLLLISLTLSLSLSLTLSHYLSPSICRGPCSEKQLRIGWRLAKRYHSRTKS